MNEYQFNNLPCPTFSAVADLRHRSEIVRRIQDGRLGDAFKLLTPALHASPLSRGIADAITIAATRIIEIETARGEVSKRDRAVLAEEAQDYQRFIDTVFLTIAGITETEAVELDKRLAAMM